MLSVKRPALSVCYDLFSAEQAVIAGRPMSVRVSRRGPGDGPYRPLMSHPDITIATAVARIGVEVPLTVKLRSR